MAEQGAAPARPSASASGAAVRLGDVTVSFRISERTTYTAVESASLAVADGEFVAIVGPTGCGKSTLLNVAAGLLAPSAGTASIFGTRLAGLNQETGYLFQADALFPWKTALENVAIGLEVAGHGKAEARRRAEAWLTRAKKRLGHRGPTDVAGADKENLDVGTISGVFERSS